MDRLTTLQSAATTWHRAKKFLLAALPPDTEATTRFTVPTLVPMSGGGGRPLAVSRDGRCLAYTSDQRQEALVASPLADNNGRNDSGSAYVLLGPSPRGGRCANPLFGTTQGETLTGTDRGDRIKGAKGNDRE